MRTAGISTQQPYNNLRYDSNGFILASKKLLKDMKFQGLEIEQKKALHEVRADLKKAAINVCQTDDRMPEKYDEFGVLRVLLSAKKRYNALKNGIIRTAKKQRKYTNDRA